MISGRYIRAPQVALGVRFRRTFLCLRAAEQHGDPVIWYDGARPVNFDNYFTGHGQSLPPYGSRASATVLSVCVGGVRHWNISQPTDRRAV